jgi:PAS domain S-box-containing protein
VRARHIALVALVLGLTLTGFFVARAITERDAGRDSERRAEVAATRIRDRIEQATSLTQSLRLYMFDAGGTGVTGDQFTRNALRWLSPADFPAAAWVEQVQAADRTAYERRNDQPIVTPDEPTRRAPPSSSYLPTTMVSGFAPMDLRGVDLRREPGVSAALLRAASPGGATATPITGTRARPSGLFLVAPAPNLINGVLRPGAVAVFVPEATLRASASAPPGLRLVSTGRSPGAPAGENTVRKGFFVAGRSFAVVIPKESVRGPAAALPWIILAAGLVLSVLGTRLGVSAGRRAKAQAELDRIFSLSSDLIAVADFDGHFTRVNPAVEQILGYTQEEFLAKPYLELVHPDDRERTAAEAASIAQGKTAQSFENRYRHKDGSLRVLEWTSTPVVKDRLMYGVARDITARRRVEAEREKLAKEQEALRRVAVLVAEDVPAHELFGAVTREVGTLLGGDYVGMARFEDNGVFTVATWAADGEHPPVPERWEMQEGDPATTIATTRRATRWTDWSAVPGPIAAFIRELGIRCTVGTPIVVEGRLWGSLALHSTKRVPLPADTESRMAQFTDLVATAVANAEARAEARLLTDEQAALRRVATTVAAEASQADTFNAIAEELAGLLGAQEMRMMRYEGDSDAVVVATSGRVSAFQVGERFPLDANTAVSIVFRTSRPARIDDYGNVPGPRAELARSLGVRGVVGAPIIVEGRLWGAMIAVAHEEPLPPDTELRLSQFTELMATAIANSEARGEVERLADEQAALRRVATVVARGGSRRQVFNAIAEEMRQLIGADFIDMLRYEDDGTAVSMASGGAADEAFAAGSRHELGGHNATSLILRTGEAVRIDNYESTATGPIAETAYPTGIRSVVGAPLVVDDRLWGSVTIGTTSEEPLPPDTEARLTQFTELMATAIANTEARAEIERLADLQTALRRVATLVASEAPPSEVFGKVAEELATVIGDVECSLWRDEHDGTVTRVSFWGEHISTLLPPGARVPIDENIAVAAAIREGRPHRIGADTLPSGPLSKRVRELGIRAAMGCPIFVRGEIWGAFAAVRLGVDALPVETEAQIVEFAELVATAIANAEARAEIERLADQQAALRRVATLVASEAPPTEVFGKVAEELATVLGGRECSVWRDEHDGTATRVAAWGERVSALQGPVRLPTDGDGVIATVLREGRAHQTRIEVPTTGTIAEHGAKLGIRAAAGCPIVVRGRVWGALGAAQYEVGAFPAEAEAKIAQFAELVATAIANADARDEVERLADEQAALRRVATLVAQGATPDVVLDAVAAEMKRLLAADAVAVGRYESAEEVTVVAHRSPDPQRAPVGTRMNYEGYNISALVRRSGKPARLEGLSEASGGFVDVFRGLGSRALVGTPIVVEGRLWGTIVASWSSETPPPADTEERMSRFAELLETAIANADTRNQLTTSRARLLTAFDEARRRVVRDLHDGAQQRLVHTIVTLKLARRAFGEEGQNGKAESLVGEALRQAERSNAELRELAHGILPSVLTRGGLRAGVDTVAERIDLPLEVQIPDDRYPPEVEASAYFVIAEALTNVVKHSHAKAARVRVSVDEGNLCIEVHDDGIGRADPDGHGLVGVRDRVTALGGHLEIESPAGSGTVVSATLPLSAG